MLLENLCEVHALIAETLDGAAPKEADFDACRAFTRLLTRSTLDYASGNHHERDTAKYA